MVSWPFPFQATSIFMSPAHSALSASNTRFDGLDTQPEQWEPATIVAGEEPPVKNR